MTKRSPLAAWIAATTFAACLVMAFVGRPTRVGAATGAGVSWPEASDAPQSSETALLTAPPAAPPLRPAEAPARPSRPARPFAAADRGADPLKTPALTHVVETAHYRVSSYLSRKTSADAADLLERAWPIWCARFDLDPSYDPGPDLFSVRLYESQGTLYSAILQETGFRVWCLGFVDFSAYRMFAVRHADEYEQRRILLHEGTHQFLYRLMGSENAAKLPRWYDEGCAHEAEKHVLADDELLLFQHRGGWYSRQMDYASGYLKTNPLTLDKIFLRDGLDRAGDDHARSCGWAVVHFLRTGAGAAEAAWFREWERALHSGDTRRCTRLARELGDTKELTQRLHAFLESISPAAESRAASRAESRAK